VEQSRPETRHGGRSPWDSRRDSRREWLRRSGIVAAGAALAGAGAVSTAGPAPVVNPEGQQPFASVLACADSRVAPEVIFDQGLGDILGLVRQ
jgi:hypothetical protein